MTGGGGGRDGVYSSLPSSAQFLQFSVYLTMVAVAGLVSGNKVGTHVCQTVRRWGVGGGGGR